MPEKLSPPKLIEFKGTAMPVVAALLRTVSPPQLAEELQALLGRTPDFFSDEAAVLDLGALECEPDDVDWPQLIELLRRYRLTPVAARNIGAALAASATAAGLVVLQAAERAARQAEPLTMDAAVTQHTPEQAETASTAASSATPQPGVEAPGTLVIDRPLRSGQQVYARGADLVVLAMVSAGAEVIADGNIHVYAPLRGRALAGACGNSAARVFTTHFEAELVSVAGVYRTFEQGIPRDLARRPAQVRLHAADDSGNSVLSIEPLSIV